MTRAISKPQFILLFIYLIFIIHTLAEPPEVVKNEFMAWRKRSHEARLSARTNRSLQSSNVTGFHSNVTGFQKPQDDEFSTNWAGAIQINPASGTYVTVSAVWFVADIVLPQGANGPGVWGASVWVGIDGSVLSPCPNVVLQAGTWTYLVIDADGNFAKGVLVWYEWFPADVVYLAQAEYAVAVGDPITVFVGASSPSEAIATFTNQNTGITATRQVSAPNSPADNICGGTAEWMLEMPSGTQLGDFGTTYIESCQATTTASDSVSLDGATLSIMVDDDKVIASPSFVSSYVLSIFFVDFL